MTRNTKTLLPERGSMEAIAKTMSRNWSLNIVPSGNACCTDGNTIFYPYNADYLKGADRKVCHGLLDHEVAHVDDERRHSEAGERTPMDYMRATRDNKHAMCLNIFCDIRIEIQKSAEYIGVGENLHAANLNSVDMFKNRHGKDSGTRTNFWHTIGCGIIMKARGYSISWLPAELAPYLAAVEQEIIESRTSEWARQDNDLALRTIAKLEQLARDLGQEAQKRAEQEKGQSDAEGKQDGEAGEGAQDGTGDDDSKAEGQDKGNGAEGQPSKQEDGQSEQAQGDKQGDDKSDMSDSEVKEAAAAGEKALNQDASITDMMNEAKDHITKMSKGEAQRSGRYFPAREATQNDRLTVETLGDLSQYQDAKAVVGEQIRGLKGKLAAVIRTRARSIKHNNQRKGKLRGTSLAKVPTGSDRIFTRTLVGDKLDTAITILIDLSGSMGGSHVGSKAYYAKLTAIALGETFEALNVPCEIIGFRTLGGSAPGIRNQYRGQNVRTGVMDYRLFKGFHETFKRVKTRLNEIRGAGNNVDGEAVWFAAKRLAQRPEARKVLFVLSDGYPRGGGCDVTALENHLNEVIKTITKGGIETVGIGVKAPAVQEFYNASNGAENIVVDDLDSLATEVYKIMKDKLLNQRRKAAVA